MDNIKVYVEVLLRVDEEGKKHPLCIIWDDGRKFIVDKVLDVRRACASKVGGTAIRYTIRIGQKLTFLYEDEGKWFVESKG